MGRATDCSGALHLGLQGLDISSKGKRPGLCRVPVSPARATTKAPLPRGQRTNHSGELNADGGIYNPLLLKHGKHHFVPFGLIALNAPARR
jgi:hypothetical protein